MIDADAAGLLVKAEIARRQLDNESTKPSAGSAPPGSAGGDDGSKPAGAVGGSAVTSTPAAARPKRFHGTVVLDPTRVGRDASRIADEVVAHLAGLVGATLRITLEVEAEIPAGAPDHVVRTVTENSRTLKFTSQAFEKE